MAPNRQSFFLKLKDTRHVKSPLNRANPTLFTPQIHQYFFVKLEEAFTIKNHPKLPFLQHKIAKASKYLKLKDMLKIHKNAQNQRYLQLRITKIFEIIRT